MKNLLTNKEITLNVLDSLDTLIYVSDVETCEIIYMNNRMKEEFNLIDKKVTGKTCFNLFEGSKGKNCKHCYVEKTVDENFLCCTWEEYNSKTEKYYRNTDSFIEWFDGRLVHLRQAVDITAEKLLGNELVEVKKIANRSNKSKSDFLVRMSKNLSTPLNSIVGLTRIASNSGDLYKIQNCLTKIDKETKDLTQTVNDVFDMAKIESNSLQLNKEPFSIENLLIGVSNTISQKCTEKNQIFQIKMDMDMPAYFIGDQLRISQVLHNLLNNAVRFTPNGGKIQMEVNQISLSNNISTIEISVSDTGFGMSRNQQANIISLFEERNRDKIGSYEGVGFGLPICKSIVDKMGGELRLYSNETIGSTFYVTMKLEVFESRYYNRKLLPGLNIKNLNLLLIDSSFEVCEYFRKIMNGFKINCDTTTTYLGVKEKLEFAKHNNKPYNIIFLEEDATNMDSLAIASLIKNNFETTTVVMISNFEKNSLNEQYRNCGVNKFIVKPLFPSQILDMINELVSVSNKGQMSYISKKYNFKGRNILLVEDVIINQEIMTKFLKDTKVELSYAENGLVALEMFKEESDKYDLILMDIHMPELNGLEATKSIRRLPIEKAKTIPIIAMTANVFEEDIKSCFKCGMNGHIPKPIEVDTLLDKIAEFLPKENNGNETKIEEYVNINEALGRVRGNVKVYKALLGNFAKSNKFENLKNELYRGEYEKAFKLAHSIKGAAANLSLNPLYEIINIIEHEILDGRSADLSILEAEKILEKTYKCIELYLELE